MKTCAIIIISLTLIEFILFIILYLGYKIKERRKKRLAIIKKRCKLLYERGDIISLNNFFEEYLLFITELPISIYDKDKDKELISFLKTISKSGYVLDKYSDDDFERYFSFGEIREIDKEKIKTLFLSSAV